MPWLHFYEKKISQKIEIVLFMLGLAHLVAKLLLNLTEDFRLK